MTIFAPVSRLKFRKFSWKTFDETEKADLQVFKQKHFVYHVGVVGFF